MPKIDGEIIKNHKQLKTTSRAAAPYSSDNSITQVFDNIFFEKQDDYVYLPITLAPGDILQATLESPKNADIDYDLVLYEYDNAELGEEIIQRGLTTYLNNYNGVQKTPVPTQTPAPTETPTPTETPGQVVKDIRIKSVTSDTSPNKVDYGYGSFYQFKRNFTVTFKVTDTSGNPVTNEPLFCLWESGSWVEGSANHQREGIGITDANGEIQISIEGPPAVGSYSYETGSRERGCR